MSTNAFDLTAGPLTPDRLFVTAFEATEALSQPFRLEVSFFPLDGEPLELKELLDKDASLLVPTPAGDRWFHGQILAARALGEQGGRLRYEIRVGPRFSRMDLVKRSRIFQEKSVSDVVKAVLDEGSVESRLALAGSYSPLEYCVQYRESDLAFASRLLERDGIFYFFEHSDSAHTMVLGDGANAFADLAGGDTLPFRREGQTPDEEYCSEAVEIHRLRTDAVVLKDFDPLRPALEVSGKEVEGKLELYDYPAEVIAPAGAARWATTRLQERSQGKLTLDVKTHCPRLWPGALFTLAEHPEDRFNRKLLVVEVRHHGKRRETLGEPEAFANTYHNEVRCLPEGTPFRPARRTPRPAIAGMQTAIVSGAAGEEIHPDEHARVKVQFHWDREGRKDDKSSCWIRVAQSWGGPGFGALYLPRIGQEVLVTFLEGNPDRPLICGSVYNGEQPPAAKLPGEKTQSAVQSSSSPGGSGHNELRFEDAAREEWIRMHAQKDLLLETVNDKAQEVRRDESLEVKNDRSREVGRHLAHEVTQNDGTEVLKDQTNTIKGKRTSDIKLIDRETVEGSQTVSIGGSYSISAKTTSIESITLAKGLHVGAAMATMVALGHNVGVGLARAETIAGTRAEVIAGSRSEVVEKNRAAKVKGDDVIQSKEQGMVTSTGDKADQNVEVGGNYELGSVEPATLAAKKVELKAESKLNLIVGGKLLITIDSGGKVQVNANTVTVEGD